MDENTILSFQSAYKARIIAQKNAFKAQSEGGDRVRLANIAAEASRNVNDARRKFEDAVYEYWKQSNG
jgi:hypothetical protein